MKTETTCKVTKHASRVEEINEAFYRVKDLEHSLKEAKADLTDKVLKELSDDTLLLIHSGVLKLNFATPARTFARVKGRLQNKCFCD